jgi:hypothetical protein
MHFGGYGHAAVTVAGIYVVGLVAAPFLPEARGLSLRGD